MGILVLGRVLLPEKLGHFPEPEKIVECFEERRGSVALVLLECFGRRCFGSTADVGEVTHVDIIRRSGLVL